MCMYYTKLLTQYQFFSLFYELVNYHKISNGMFIFCSFFYKLVINTNVYYKSSNGMSIFVHFSTNWVTYYKISNEMSNFFSFSSELAILQNYQLNIRFFFYFTQVHYFYIKKIPSKSQVVLHHKIHYLLLDVTNVSSIFNKLSL